MAGMAVELAFFGVFFSKKIMLLALYREMGCHLAICLNANFFEKVAFMFSLKKVL
jgi:hypothetical protein